MSSAETVSEGASQPGAGAAVDLKLEVVVVPVADVDRARRFYQSLKWRLDADFNNGGDWHLVQMTPPGSPCSVFLGKGVTTAAPGSLQGTVLVVNDVKAARAELAGYGADVSEVFHFENNLIRASGTTGHVPGPDPKGASYFSFASFADPDGNTWLLQEITTRFPGRGIGRDVPSLTDVLREAEQDHGKFEATAAKHHWSDWYSAYIVAREQGRTPEQAAEEGARNVARILAPAGS
jgi:catechol 2,3-dioxygenase-like lactoylglutathione lyase family enzyme